MNFWITGGTAAHDDFGVADEIMKLGLSFDGLESQLIDGFKQFSPRLHFIHSYLDEDEKHRHGLLYLTCMIAGISMEPSILPTTVQTSLYTVFRESLGKAMLNTPLGLPIIYAMLVASTWSLSPELRGRYIDSWLLSGSVVLHSMLAIDLTNSPNPSDLDNSGIMSRILAWNAACLAHFKFSVGTGKPSVIHPDLMNRFIQIVKQDPRFSETDRKVASELQLYILLYKAVIQRSVPAVEIRREIGNWHRENFIEDDIALSFSFSATMLVLERWELAQLHQLVAVSAHRVDMGTANNSHHGQLEELTASILHHCHLVVEKMGTYAALVGTVQTYDFLLSAYAAITLVEYSECLPDVQATFRLMERVHLEQRGVKKEPVFNWAKNMMHKRATDRDRQAERSQQRWNSDGAPAVETWWAPSELLNSALNFSDVDMYSSLRI
ncbi:hypothetical protein BX600DRAFT_513542 [Xylariales sp. PMI_506]|nr:hypothetical protein BX600DRAFT_513542 [Xylariales sp. PMI_506]